MRFNKLAYLLATTICLASCTATQTAPLPQQKETIKENQTHTYLDEFPFDPYPSIGSIAHSNGVLIGSAVLVAPNILLTAAHVTEGREDLMFVEFDGDEHCVKEVIYYPTYVAETLEHDIAIVVLETNSNEEPVEFADYTFKRMKLTTVGYGTGRKRFSNYGVFWYYGRLIKKPQYMIMLPIEGTMWFGDSGGAVVTLDNKLVGIMSYFQVTDSGKIYENGCASIEYYKDWIRGVIESKTSKTS